jgi:hypothetical protein
VVPPVSRPDSRTGRYSGTLPHGAPVFSYRALTVSGAPFQGTSPDTLHNSAGPTTPLPQGERFRLGPVRSPLLRPSRLISLPRGTEMFQFPRFALVRKRVTELAPSRVAPFGHPGISACVPLPLAYRSLPRPSSPPCAQASPTCLHSLDYKACSGSSLRQSSALAPSSRNTLPKQSAYDPYGHTGPRLVETSRKPSIPAQSGICLQE